MLSLVKLRSSRLDVRPFGDGEAHVGEDLDAFVVDLADGMDAAVGDGTEPNRQRDVGALAGQPLRQRLAFQRSLARLQRVADARFELVDRLAEALALLRRQRAERLHQLGDAALLAEHGDAHLLDGGKIARASNAGEQFALERSEGLSLSDRGHADELHSSVILGPCARGPSVSSFASGSKRRTSGLDPRRQARG